MLAAYTPHGHLPEVLGWSCFAETGVHQRPRYLTTSSINFFCKACKYLSEQIFLYSGLLWKLKRVRNR